jgi:hypothetical protein
MMRLNIITSDGSEGEIVVPSTTGLVELQSWIGRWDGAAFVTDIEVLGYTPQ